MFSIMINKNLCFITEFICLNFIFKIKERTVIYHQNQQIEDEKNEYKYSYKLQDIRLIINLLFILRKIHQAMIAKFQLKLIDMFQFLFL